MKRIIFSSYDHIFNPYYAGGGAKAIHEVAKRLTPFYEVSIVTAPYAGAHTPKLQVDSVTYEYLGPTIPHPQLGQLIFQSALPFAVQHRDFDIWIESFTPPFSTAFLPHFTSRPVIGLVHLLAGQIMATKYRLPIFKWLEKRGLKKYQHLIALTKNSKNELNNLNQNSQIHIIPNGVDLREELARGNDRKNWLYLGRIDFEQKGLDILLSAFTKIAPTHEWNLFIAGSGTQSDVLRLKKMIAVSPYAHRIYYLGEIRGKEKAALLAEAGAVLVPSRYETQPLVILESFAAGCPVIMSDISDLQWIPSNCGWKVGNSASELANGMQSFYANHSQSLSTVENAWNFVQSYNWDGISQQYITLFESVAPSITD